MAVESFLKHPKADRSSVTEEFTMDLDEQKTLDRIRHHIANPPATSRVMTITPSICPALLEYNVSNRPKKDKKIAEYANYMMAGEWMLTRRHD
jgi:hypothetical protein